MLNISNTIKHLRIKKHYTQDEIAEICKVSRQAVAKWESGANLPDIEKLIILSQVFEVSVDELITGNGYSVRISDSINRDNNTENERIVNEALKRATSYEDPADALNHFISYIGKQIGCDRLYIFEQNPDGSFKNSYEWCNKGISPQIEYLQSIPLEDMSVWLDKFATEDFIFIENIEDISDSEPVVYRWIKPQDIQSLLVYPLFGGRGFLGADNPAPAFILQTRYLLEIMICFVENMIKNRDLKQELQRTVLQSNHFLKVSKGVCYQLNTDSGVLQYDMSQAADQGYSFKANTLSELEELASLHPEFHDHLMIDGIQKVIESKENVSIEFISYRKNQEIRWNRLSISPFVDSNGKVLQLYGVLQDVSGEHHIVEQYNKYIFHLSGGLHICYLSSPIHLDYVSDSLCEVAGYDRAEFTKVVGSKYTNIIYKEDRAIFRRHVQRLSAAPGVDSCEYRIVKKDGSIVQVLDTMESVADSSGITYGYAYILEKNDLAAMLNMAEEKDKKQIELINRQYEVLAALGKDYLNVFRVWLDEDKAQIINLNGYVVKGMDKNSAEYIPYFRFCKQYI